MQPRLRHSWDLTPSEARDLQLELQGRVRPRGKLPRGSLLVAGMDAATDGHPFYGRGGERLFAAVCLLRWPEGDLVEERTAACRAAFPYIPGLLSFREIPVLIRCLEKLQREPDLLVCDGQGLAHPRRFGLACHVGVLFEKPTLGIAKSLLGGDVREPARRRGSRRPIRWDGEIVGHAVRTRDGVKPVYVSPGHRLDHDEAVRLTLWLHSRYRIPAPTRLADRSVRLFKRAVMAGEASD